MIYRKCKEGGEQMDDDVIVTDDGTIIVIRSSWG
jgi:hypothetical protein